MKVCFLLHLCLLSCSISVTAQTDSLHQVIATMDSLAFDAYNRRDLDDYSNYLAQDIEFYHDQDGLITPYQKLVDAFAILFRPDRPTHAVRRIVPGSIEVFPINSVGALQTGHHKFYELDPVDSTYNFSSIANMTALWKQTVEGWKMSKVFSYDHHAPDYSDRVIDLLDRYSVPYVAVGTLSDSSFSSAYYARSERHPDQRDLFNIASMTKPLVAMAVLELVQEGSWSLTEPLSRYFVDPDIEYSSYSDSITTYHVLHHQTGFPNWRGDNKLAFNFAPGSAYGYSGEGFEYLRRALEAAFDKPLQQIVRETLLTKLEMNDTYFIVDDELDTSRIAKAYDRDMNPYSTAPRKEANAADDVLTTPADYLKFLRYIGQQYGKKGSSYQLITETVQEIEDSGMFMGAGWFVSKDQDGQKVIWHSGADRGVRSIAMLNLKTGQGIVILTDSDGGVATWGELTELLSPNLSGVMRSVQAVHN